MNNTPERQSGALRHTFIHTFSNYDVPFVLYSPPSGPGGLSRECVLRIPMRAVKDD